MDENYTEDSGIHKNPETKRINLHGYGKYQEFLQNVKDKTIFVFFTCTESPTSGYSWCPLCIQVSLVRAQFNNLSKYR